MTGRQGENGQVELARAKVNLTLHVGAVREDGYHPVDSLVVFASIGDELTFTSSDEMHLNIYGTGVLPTGPDNIILRTMEIISAPPREIVLKKELPVSAGLGGGSANAAAVLRVFGATLSDKRLAYDLGADVPVCFKGQTAMMRGIGELVEPIEDLGQISAVLVNPGVPVSTGAIFKAMDAQLRAVDPRGNAEAGDLLSRALAGENDMQDFAIAQAPVITDVLRALSLQSGCQLARMSGSGATCFGVFRSDAQAQAVAETLSASYPDWWVRSCRLGDPS